MICILLDIDGTVANLNHRLLHVQGNNRNWKEFFDGIPNDLPIEQTIWLANVLAERSDVQIIMASGRSEDERTMTEEWLDTHGVPRQKLYMRKSKDYRPDHIIKIELLEEMREDGYEPFLVIDDRPKVVEAWRKAGLFVLQCENKEENDPTQWHPFHESHKYPLTILVGPSGSGKSTLVNDMDGVISSDNIRKQLLGSDRDQSDNYRVFNTAKALATERLRLGLPVIIDATNLRTKDRVAMAKLAPESMLVKYVVINRPMQDKIRDGDWRNEVMIKNQSLLERHEELFNANLKAILRGDNLPNVVVENIIQK